MYVLTTFVDCYHLAARANSESSPASDHLKSHLFLVIKNEDQFLFYKYAFISEHQDCQLNGYRWITTPTV